MLVSIRYGEYSNTFCTMIRRRELSTSGREDERRLDRLIEVWNWLNECSQYRRAFGQFLSGVVFDHSLNKRLQASRSLDFLFLSSRFDTTGFYRHWALTSQKNRRALHAHCWESTTTLCWVYAFCITHDFSKCLVNFCSQFLPSVWLVT